MIFEQLVKEISSMKNIFAIVTLFSTFIISAQPSDTIEIPNSYCDSIVLNPILPLYGNLEDDFLLVGLETYFTDYSISYAGLMLVNYLGDTIAIETLNSAGNVYSIGPNMSEERQLMLMEDLVFPFTGELCIVEGLFAGNPNIVCSYPVNWNFLGLNEMQNKPRKLIKMIDVLGNEKENHQSGKILFYLYDNGESRKRYKI